MPSFQGISALVGKTVGIVELGLNLRRRVPKQASRFNLAKNQGILQPVLKLIQKRRPKMVESCVLKYRIVHPGLPHLAYSL
jgi:hypothetical protein